LSVNLCRALISAAVPLLLAPTSAWAGESFDGWNFYTTMSVYAMCTSESGEDRRACDAYVCGAFDGFAADAIVNRHKTYAICPPRATSCHRLSQVFTDYVEKHPVKTETQAAGTVGFSLQQAFPCH
jgi:hypothetical protein